MKAAWIALLVTCVTWAQSNPPAPGSGDAAAQPQTHAADRNEKTNEAQRETDNFASVIEKAVPSVVQPETKNEEKKTRWDSSSEWWLVYITGALVAFTGALAFYTARLYRATVGLGRDAKNTASVQFEELREARIRQHRPRLHVRNVTIDKHTLETASRIVGRFYVSNIGGERAHVIESHCEILQGVDGLPMQAPYEGKPGNNPLPERPTLPAGSSCVGTFDSGETPFPAEAIYAIGAAKFYVIGWIEYLDDLAIRRRVAFCREFLRRGSSARFYPTNDPDYEYEE